MVSSLGARLYVHVDEEQTDLTSSMSDMACWRHSRVSVQQHRNFLSDKDLLLSKVPKPPNLMRDDCVFSTKKSPLPETEHLIGNPQCLPEERAAYVNVSRSIRSQPV